LTGPDSFQPFNKGRLVAKPNYQYEKRSKELAKKKKKEEKLRRRQENSARNRGEGDEPEEGQEAGESTEKPAGDSAPGA
jgi:hypothetical protein